MRKKEASMDCRMLAVSNLKFLKLLPGRLSTCCASDPALATGFSTGAPLLDEFFAFHTVPAQCHVILRLMKIMGEQTTSSTRIRVQLDIYSAELLRQILFVDCSKNIKLL